MRIEIVVFAALVASACAQGWWKPGASAADLQADQRECQAEAGIAEPEARGELSWGQSPAIDRCMRDRGWRGGKIAIPLDSTQPKPSKPSDRQIQYDPHKR